MFLFTTPAPATPPPPPRQPGSAPVVDAIRQGATTTGTDFDYLLRTARRESALDPDAKAPTSSATGLFQFLDQTWLGILKSDGERLGLGEQAKAVTSRPDGSLTVADPAARQAILDLRRDPQAAAMMAGALTRQNGEAIAAAVGRPPSSGELYMAHVLGARGAVDLITTASRDPGRAAALDFPEAARANRAIFYASGGRPRGAGEVYAVLASAQAGASGSATTAAAAPTGLAAAAPTAASREPGLRGMFQTGARTGPLSDAVARIWRGNTGRGTAETAASFFPRGAGSSEPDERNDEDLPAVASAAADAGAGLAFRFDIPLPPVRPDVAPTALERPARASIRPDSSVARSAVRP